MRSTRILNAFLLTVVALLIAAHSTKAQDIQPETGSGAGLNYDCDTGWNIPVQDWLWTCWVIMDTIPQSIEATRDSLAYSYLPAYDEDMVYSREQWQVIYGELRDIELAFWADWRRTCRAGTVAVKLYCALWNTHGMLDWAFVDGEGLYVSFIEHFSEYTNLLGIPDDVAQQWQQALVCQAHPEYERCLGFTPITNGQA